jgi:hypothetical protein
MDLRIEWMNLDLFNEALPTVCYVATNGRVIMYQWLEIIWKIMAMAYFKVLCQYLSREAGYNHKILI